MADEVDGKYSGPFNIHQLNEHLQVCIRKEDGEVDIGEYILIFQNLHKFFCVLGTIFSFVGTDVKAKCEILQQHKCGEHCSHYETLEKMISYEKTTGIITSNKDSNGCRTLLRLHRALVFVSQFLEKITELEDEEGTTQACKDAYNQTLAKHHPWMIQNGARLAMYALPTKKNLIKRVCGAALEKAEVTVIMKEVIQATQMVYDKCESIYKENQLLDLP